MRSLINAKISGFRLWIIPEPLVPRQEDRRLGERDCDTISRSAPVSDSQLQIQIESGARGMTCSNGSNSKKASPIETIFFFILSG